MKLKYFWYINTPPTYRSGFEMLAFHYFHFFRSKTNKQEIKVLMCCDAEKVTFCCCTDCLISLSPKKKQKGIVCKQPVKYSWFITEEKDIWKKVIMSGIINSCIFLILMISKYYFCSTNQIFGSMVHPKICVQEWGKITIHQFILRERLLLFIHYKNLTDWFMI